MQATAKRERRRSVLAPYLFIAPVIILLFIFNVMPLLISFFISLFDADISFHLNKFIGLGNFAEVFSDNRFYNSLGVTLKWTVVEVPCQLILALILAGLLTRNTVINKIFRAIYFMPIVCSATATGIMWKLILHSNVGYITYLLLMMGFGKITFMNTAGLTFYVIVFMSVWKTFGISTTILIGAMQNVPTVLYEAADIDGCSRARQFFAITLPGIRPTLWFLIMTRIIGSFQVFDIVYTTTGGGPSLTTETLVTYIYTRGFEVFRMGYASSLSVVLLGLILIITVIMYAAMLKGEKD